MPDGAVARLTKIAETADRFLLQGMERQGYPPAVKTLFRRGADGTVEVLHVRGEHPVASGKYDKPTYAMDAIKQAVKQYRVGEKGDVWWLFIYLGDRPKRFNDWRGGGDVVNGGWSMVNYDTVPGEIRPDLHLTEGFNREYFLKSTIHELAHAFGLPHMGPDPGL